MEPVSKFCIVDNIWCKEMHFVNSGDSSDGHKHTHDHVTLIAKGKVRVTANNQTKEFSAPNMVLIKKDQEHLIEALEDGTVTYCIHGLRDYDSGDIIDSEMVIGDLDDYEPIVLPKERL